MSHFPFGYFNQPWPIQPLTVSAAIASDVQDELISLDDAKLFLRVSVTTDDDLIKSLIRASRQYTETRTGRSLIKKDYILSLNRFPTLYFDNSVAIDLRFPPLADVDRIEYIDSSDTLQILSSDKFQIDAFSTPGRVAPLPANLFWPTARWGALNPVKIFYSAGYEARAAFPSNTNQNQTTITIGDAQNGNGDINRAILEDLITAMKQLIVHWYQNRDVVIAMPGAGGVYAPLPIHLDQIIDQHRLLNMALTF